MPSFPLATLAYPRTGRRGVPQQFPRRLYEMLEGETNLAEISPHDHHEIISWSESGKAFGILDAALFASHILPKYFRTSKYSSFQRNLNLYGFSKVRHGPDADMYSHPDFIRGHPETLSQLKKQLRKCKTQRRISGVHNMKDSLVTRIAEQWVYPVSPSPPTSPHGESGASPQHSMASPSWQSHAGDNLSPRPYGATNIDFLPTYPNATGKDKLALLTMALDSIEGPSCLGENGEV